MIRVEVRHEGGRVTALKAQGHAGGAAAGENIVCAAVSSLMTTAANALESVAGVKPDIRRDDQQALLDVALPEACESQDAQIILRTILQGLTDISMEYPKQVSITTQDGRTTL